MRQRYPQKLSYLTQNQTNKSTVTTRFCRINIMSLPGAREATGAAGKTIGTGRASLHTKQGRASLHTKQMRVG